jgi:tetratricopeptide (TPR) repeat protein
MLKGSSSGIASAIGLAFALVLLTNSPALSGDAGTALNEGDAAKRQGKPEAAIQYYTEAIASGELSELDLIRAHTGRGEALGNLGQQDAAIGDYTAAIEISLGESNSYNNRGVAYKRFGRYAEALKDFNTAISLDPGNAIVYLNRGGTYLEKKQFAEALADLDTALGLEPED